VIFFPSNQADSATLTESTQNAYYPAENIQYMDKEKVWKTSGAQAAETLLFNLGSAKSVTACVVAGHDFDGTETNIKIQGNATDSWGSPTVNETLTYAAGTFAKTFAGASLQYWRLIFTKANATDIKSIGRVYLGAHVTVDAPDHAGIGWSIEPLDDVSDSIGSKRYASNRGHRNNFSIPFSNLTETDVAKLRTIFDAHLSHTPLWFQIDTNSPLADYWYMYFANKSLEPRMGGFGSEYYWNVILDFQEAL
jgi:hypothetical protein